MNTLNVIDVYYLRQDKTIETVLLSNCNKEKVVYIYNYQGWFFRVFDNILDLINFFDDWFEPKIWFEDEKKLDRYLERMKL